MSQNIEIQDVTRIDALYERISALIEQARQRVVTTINIAEVYTKYSIGEYIVEDEQQGRARAEYGKQVLKVLSARLTERFGDGWSYSNLRQIRQFYLVYGNLTDGVCQIENDNQCLSNSSAVLTNLDIVNSHCPNFSLSWSHYLILMRIENSDARSFYEIECTHQQWSVRQLSRQVGSSLYERLALSRNKDEVMRPTIGILLCESKKDSLVELTLPKDANIYATAYQLYLPDKALLQAKVKEWIKEYEEIHPEETENGKS